MRLGVKVLEEMVEDFKSSHATLSSVKLWSADDSSIDACERESF